MDTIKKKIVTDENSRPVAVQIDYEDWLEIERLLKRGEKPDEEQQDDFEELLDKLGEMWQGGDGLEYQMKIREEWDDR